MQVAKELELIKVDKAQGRVFLRSSAPSLDDRLMQLNSEDAKMLAVSLAAENGLSGAMLKHAVMMYGDAEKGEPAKSVNLDQKMDPFLCVEIHSEYLRSNQAAGDSILR